MFRKELVNYILWLQMVKNNSFYYYYWLNKIFDWDILDLYTCTKCIHWEKVTLPKKMNTTGENNRDEKSPGYTTIVLWMKTNWQHTFWQNNPTWSTSRTKTGLSLSSEKRLKFVYTEAKNQKSPMKSNQINNFEFSYTVVIHCLHKIKLVQRFDLY